MAGDNDFPLSKREALRVGAKFYFTGKPCVRGHICTRYVSGSCSVCARTSAKKWSEDNPGKRKAISASFWKNNADRLNAVRAAEFKADPEKFRTRWKSYSERRPEVAVAAKRRWAERNPEHAVVSKAKRRARLAEAGGSLCAADVTAAKSEQGHQCNVCQQPVALTLDHIVPLARGGSNDSTNIQMLCLPCNLKKGAKPPIQFLSALSIPVPDKVSAAVIAHEAIEVGVLAVKGGVSVETLLSALPPDSTIRRLLAERAAA